MNQQQQEIFRPLRIYVVPKSLKNKKVRKDGNIICYKCHWCKYQSFNQGHTRCHMKKCFERDKIIQQQQKQNLFQQFVSRERNQINEHIMEVEGQQKVEMMTKISQIERRIQALQTGKFSDSNRTNEKAKRLSQQIIQQNASLFIGCIQVQLSKVIKKWLQMNVDVENVKFEIVSKILDKLREINFYDLVDNFKKNLDRFQAELERDISQKVHVRTWARIKMSYNFLKKYEEIHFIHQVKLIEDLMNQSPYLRKHVTRYHKKMTTQYSDFFPFKALPKRLSKFEQIVPKKQVKITMDRVRQEIFTLIEKQEYQLATDLWSTTCMGLRKSELMNMKFRNVNGEFAFALQMYQQKNKHETMRLVPNSLKNLIKLYEIQFPMTKWRFMRLKNFCFTHFNAFYGLRHLCITTLMAGLFENNILARVHKDHRTTSTFYIDQESADIINKMFLLPGFNEQKSEQFNKQYKILFIFDKNATISEKRIIQSERVSLPPPDITAEQNIDMRQIDGLACSNDDQMKNFLEKSQLSLNEKCEIVSKRYSIVHEEKESNLESFNSLEKTIESLVQQNSGINEVINDEICSRGERKTDQKLIMVTSEILQSPVKFVSFKQNDSTPLSIKQINFNEQEVREPVLILKHYTNSGQNIYHIQQDQKIRINSSIRQRLDRNAKQNKRYVQDQLPILKYLPPLCPSCRKQRIRLEACQHKIHGSTYCTQCQYRMENCQRASPVFTQIKITSQNFRQSKDYYPSIKKKHNKNNIKFVIENIRQSQMVKSSKYKSDVPDFITSLPVFSKKMKDEIHYNRNNQQFLPIQLRIVSNEKGYGVFALQKIAKDQLICTYEGVIGTHRTCDISHDSSFTLGWLQDREGIPLNLITEAKKFCNVGRFLNSSNYDGAPDMNCQCKYGVIQQGTNFQIVPVNKELIWYYGDKYWAE